MKKKIFISQKMRGRSKEDIMEERNKIFDYLFSLFDGNIEILPSFLNEHTEHKPLYYLGESLKIMSEADLIVFAPGWRLARGCQVEHYCTIWYGYPYMEIKENGDSYNSVICQNKEDD